MNDDQNRLLRQLEQATSRETVDDDALDADTARLREGWLALARLLEADEVEIDERAIVAPIERIERTKTLRRISVAVMTLAASLLMITSAVWFLSDRGSPSNRVVPQQAAIPKQQPSPSMATDIVSDDTQFAWDDSLDDQFAQVTQNIADFRSQSYLDDLSYDVLNDRLERIGRDINEL